MASIFVAVALIGASAAPIDSVESPPRIKVNGSAPVDYYGVDVSQPVSQADFKCLRDLNLRYAIIRCYRSLGSVDPACAGSAAAAHAGGMDTVHAYLFPCPKCGDPRGQVGSLLSYFTAQQVDVKRLWLDVEGSQYWLGSASSNQKFYQGLVDACASFKLVCGVYSSKVQWSSLFGSASFSYGSALPLWYAHYDQTASFGDFESFGGWSAPTIKQFSDAGAKCGVGYDINWSPSLPQ